MISSRLAFALVPLCVAGLRLDAQVTFERAGYRLTSLGERMTVSGRVVDASRRPVSSTSIRWRIADPSIATVTAQGVVVSRKVGNTKLWAIAGEDSASALILVDQWAAKFDFAPAVLRLDAVGAKAPLRIIVRDAGGHPIAGQNRRPTSCRSVNEAIASLSTTGDVVAKRNGVTYVRCADRGIADSVRVEVRQRPARASIVNKLNLATKIVGDTFRIRVTATDAAGGVIENVQPTWASLNPTIVSVDPLSGLARSVGAGSAKVVAQAGDITDTVSIAVAPGLGLAVPVNTDSAESGPLIRMPTLKIDAVYPFEGDTTPIRFIARDANGAEVPNPIVTLRSNDEGVFTIISGRRLLPKKAGSAWLVGQFGTSAIDSAQIVVRARGSVRLASTAGNTASNFRRPTFDTATLNRTYRTLREAALDSIFDSSRVVGLKAPGRLLSLTGIAGQAVHSFTDSTGKENRTGLMYGGIAQLAPLRWVRLGAAFRTGTLSTSGTTGGNDLTVTEVSGILSVHPTDNLAVGGTYMLRATREGESATPVATQQWTVPRAFVTVRGQFIGGFVRPFAGVNAVTPGATYTGYVSQGKTLNPKPGTLGGEAGIDVHTGLFRVGLTYNVENFTFEKVGNSVRRDQFSTVGIRFGLEYAR
jgi:hypothetical protein